MSLSRRIETDINPIKSPSSRIVLYSDANNQHPTPNLVRHPQGGAQKPGPLTSPGRSR